ncbi:MAG TPA: response regulator [Phycisphaerae bacterium]|nr:response regulator [Phycisphaerae bacterium]
MNLSAASEIETPLPPSKVLLVDDEAQIVELLEAYLAEIPNVSTVGASSGQEALAKVAADPPDLILLDIMMPRMSGFEVCKKLKADPATKDIPIIMVTALYEESDVERGLEVGTNDFVTKPLNRVDLVTRVKTLLRLRHAQKQSGGDMDYLGELGASS